MIPIKDNFITCWKHRQINLTISLKGINSFYKRKSKGQIWYLKLLASVVQMDLLC